jgi:tetratricopeptide (TPR) repeat protein
MFELDAKLNSKVTRLANEGDKKAEQGDWEGQIKSYLKVWRLIPEPKVEWEGGTWILGGIAEAFYQKGDFADAKKYFAEALKCYDGEENSFLLFRLGQLSYDEDDFENAKARLKRAWDLSEGRQFIGEPKKYRDFLLSKKR